MTAPCVVPESLRTEHEALSEELDRLTREAGQIGEAAREVAERLRLHVRCEEEIALPPLGLLPELAAGHVRPDMRPVMELAHRLRVDLPRLLDDHIAIVGLAEALRDKAREMGRIDAASLAQNLILHAEAEEDVLYPAAILVGQYLQLVLGKQA
jgi:hypothetical protein